jgi:hypothetical protein
MPLSRQFLFLATVGFVLTTAPALSRETAGQIFAANRLATGGAKWNNVGAIHLLGTITAGGSPGPFETYVDRSTGHSRTIAISGSLRDESGYDGSLWDKQNGILTIADLPSLVLDARSQAYVACDGWWKTTSNFGAVTQHDEGQRTFDVVVVTPLGGSGIEVWLDHATHLVDRLVFSTDAGPLTSRFSDWRSVDGGVRLPFRRVDTDATGQKTSTIVREAQLVRKLPSSALARPAPEQHRIMIGALDSAIPFQLTAFERGHVVVPALVNGNRANVIFDSGGANYFSPEAAKRFGLIADGGINIGGVGTSGVVGGIAAAQRITVGAAGLRDQAVIVGPLPYPALYPRAGLTVDGLIGFEFLSEYRTTFDYPAHSVSFAAFDAPADRQGVTLPFYSDGHSIYVEAAVEGARGLFRLDTGDGGTLTLFATFSTRHRLFQQGGMAMVNAGGVGGSVASQRIKAAKVQFGGQLFSQTPIEISGTTAGAFASRSIGGNIGAGLMSRFRVTFDYRARTVTFVPARDVQRPFRHDLTGLSLSQDDASALIVLSVAAASPAEAAGVKRNDHIVSLDGRSVEAERLGIFDLSAPRYDVEPFALGLKRGPNVVTVKIHPADFQH